MTALEKFEAIKNNEKACETANKLLQGGFTWTQATEMAYRIYFEK